MDIIVTDRLILRLLNLEDYKFIKTLLNTKGWIKFIGDRNILNLQDAKDYIKRIIDNKKIKYWVVCLKENEFPIGIISFIKRDYLKYNDLGFAFLPKFCKNGYAFESANSILDNLKASETHQFILATTIPENHKSIVLLQKLGFIFNEKILNNNEELMVFIKELS